MQVKALYIKNLPKDITQDQLRELFEDHGKIIKVVLPPAKAGQEKSRFGFVHFAERSSAMKALKNKEKYEIDGNLIILALWLIFLSTSAIGKKLESQFFMAESCPCV